MSLGSTVSHRVESPNRGRESIKEFACRGVGSSEDGRPKSGHGSQERNTTVDNEINTSVQEETNISAQTNSSLKGLK